MSIKTSEKPWPRTTTNYVTGELEIVEPKSKIAREKKNGKWK